MSRRKDRERAKSGVVFRNGHMVDLVEWELAHPTRAQRQQVIDDAIVAEMAIREEPYSCSKCNIKHTKGKIHMAHRMYRKS